MWKVKPQVVRDPVEFNPQLDSNELSAYSRSDTFQHLDSIADSISPLHLMFGLAWDEACVNSRTKSRAHQRKSPGRGHRYNCARLPIAKLH